MRTWPTPQDSSHLGTIDRVPADVSHLSKGPGEQRPARQVEVFYNEAFDHFFVSDSLTPAYYEDYLMATSFSAKMGAHQDRQADELARLAPAGSRFLEVGCGDGAFLARMVARLGSGVGVEPSATFAAEARARGLEVVHRYMDADLDLPQAPFGCFGSRQVFEHLPDPLATLRHAARHLQPGAVGLIEVPNGARSFAHGRFFDVFPDHLQYYSARSLTLLAGLAGFAVLSCHESFGGDYLELWVRYTPAPGAWAADRLAHLRGHADHAAEAVGRFLLAAKGRGESAVLWGAGAKGLSLVARLPAEAAGALAGVVDSDPHKIGRFVPNTRVEVLAPARLREAPPAHVLIVALSYVDEIAAAARELAPAARILALTNGGDVTEVPGRRPGAA